MNTTALLLAVLCATFMLGMYLEWMRYQLKGLKDQMMNMDSNMEDSRGRYRDLETRIGSTYRLRNPLAEEILSAHDTIRRVEEDWGRKHDQLVEAYRRLKND
jgi:hypothetical protein